MKKVNKIKITSTSLSNYEEKTNFYWKMPHIQVFYFLVTMISAKYRWFLENWPALGRLDGQAQCVAVIYLLTSQNIVEYLNSRSQSECLEMTSIFNLNQSERRKWKNWWLISTSALLDLVRPSKTSVQATSKKVKKQRK